MELSSELRAQIVALCDSGLSQTAVAKMLKLSRQCVNYTLKRFRETGSFKSKPRSGRPSVTSPATDRMIRRKVLIDPTISSTCISRELPENVHVKPRTIRHRLLQKYGLKSRAAARKPRLSVKNVRDRLKFCHHYKHWTTEMWNKVLFSDETLIQQFSVAHRRVRRPLGCRYERRYCVPTVKHSPSVMIWGSMSSSGRGNLWFLPPNQTMNARRYLQVLQDRLRPMMNIRATEIFMHDGAPCHRARSVTNWLHEQSIRLLHPWPGNSPDLNPIENLWSLVKRRVSSHHPSSLTALKEVIKSVWCTEIDAGLCRKLVHSMPDRIKMVIKNKGFYSKY